MVSRLRRAPFNPLLVTLPRVLVEPRPPDGSGVIEQLVKRAVAESQAPSAGGECVLARLSELLFVELVRRYLAQLPADQVGWLVGLRNASVGRVLGLLHERPAHPFSLDELARDMGMSRAVLAERFTHHVGVPAEGADPRRAKPELARCRPPRPNVRTVLSTLTCDER